MLKKKLIRILSPTPPLFFPVYAHYIDEHNGEHTHTHNHKKCTVRVLIDSLCSLKFCVQVGACEFFFSLLSLSSEPRVVGFRWVSSDIVYECVHVHIFLNGSKMLKTMIMRKVFHSFESKLVACVGLYYIWSFWINVCLTISNDKTIKSTRKYKKTYSAGYSSAYVWMIIGTTLWNCLVALTKTGTNCSKLISALNPATAPFSLSPPVHLSFHSEIKWWKKKQIVALND